MSTVSTIRDEVVSLNVKVDTVIEEMTQLKRKLKDNIQVRNG